MKGINNVEDYNSDKVEWAFWNDEFQATSTSYDEAICNYNAYSAEAIPYVRALSTS